MTADDVLVLGEDADTSELGTLLHNAASDLWTRREDTLYSYAEFEIAAIREIANRMIGHPSKPAGTAANHEAWIEE